MSAAITQPETDTILRVIGENLAAQEGAAIGAGLRFDAEDSARPHLDVEIARERAEAAMLRQQLRQFWRVEDAWRDYLKGIGAL